MSGLESKELEEFQQLAVSYKLASQAVESLVAAGRDCKVIDGYRFVRLDKLQNRHFVGVSTMLFGIVNVLNYAIQDSLGYQTYLAQIGYAPGNKQQIARIERPIELADDFSYRGSSFICNVDLPILRPGSFFTRAMQRRQVSWFEGAFTLPESDISDLAAKQYRQLQREREKLFDPINIARLQGGFYNELAMQIPTMLKVAVASDFDEKNQLRTFQPASVTGDKLIFMWWLERFQRNRSSSLVELARHGNGRSLIIRRVRPDDVLQGAIHKLIDAVEAESESRYRLRAAAWED